MAAAAAELAECAALQAAYATVKDAACKVSGACLYHARATMMFRDSGDDGGNSGVLFVKLCLPPTNSTNLLTNHRLLPKCPRATKVLARPLRNYRNPSPGPKAETNDSATAPRALNALGAPTVATAPITIRLARGHRSIPCNTVRSSQCCAGRASRGVAPVAQSTSTLWLKCRCDGLRRRAANAAVALAP